MFISESLLEFLILLYIMWQVEWPGNFPCFDRFRSSSYLLELPGSFIESLPWLLPDTQACFSAHACFHGIERKLNALLWLQEE